MPTVQANGVQLYYELTGDRGDPVLLIHGSWNDHGGWDAVVPGLSKNFRVVSYDRRGHSRSERPATRGSAQEDAADAAALLRALDLAPAHIVGTSFGGNVALKLAATDQSVFRTLTVHEAPLWEIVADDSAASLLVKERIKLWDVVREPLQRGDDEAGARAFVEKIAFGPGQWEKISPELRAKFLKNGPTWLDEDRDPHGFDLDLEAISKSRVRTLLTYGEQSKTLPFSLVMMRLETIIPNSRLVQIMGAGHTPQVSQPEEHVKLLTDFFEGRS